SSQASLGSRADLFQSELSRVTASPNWQAEFGPRLVRTVHDGKVHIDTRLTRTMGMATVMVAGMTPTTCSERLVAAINGAGYHAEFAGGGVHSEKDMAEKLTALAASIPPGQGITLNCIYINPRQWTFQFPALLRLRREGVPVDGLCIGGGVPSFGAALEIIGQLRDAGIRHVAFKPSSAKAIRNVVRVARAAEGFPVILQWTGGRAGGHHSCEDFHQPILETYAAVRACANVALVAGSGFGDAAGTLPYMTGEWSTRFGRAPMPFDGILLGSRIMVAKEAATSLAAKELIVAAAGLPDSEWDTTYDGARGGVITVVSEYGELIHALETRATSFLKDIYRTVLSQPREKQPAILQARRSEIIARLNSDYMRPWFGKKADGRVVDLEDMTYAEVVGRMVALMYVKHQQRWIHTSYRQAVVDFIARAERRLCVSAPDAPLVAELGDANPLSYARRLVDEYPGAAKLVLSSEDVQFFVGLCKRRGQKPLPFIPVLDSDFGVLLQKDTIWQSEDVDSVVDSDPQRTGVQQGPVAAPHSTTVDEPVKDILDSIYHSHIESLIERLHGGDKSSIPVVEYVGADPVAESLPSTVLVEASASKCSYQMPASAGELPERGVWLQALAGPRKSWLRALLTAPAIVQGDRLVSNYVLRMLRPRPSQVVTVHFADGLPSLVEIVGPTGLLELELLLAASSTVRLTVNHQTLYGKVVPFPLEFDYCPTYILAPIQGSKSAEDDSVRDFCNNVWAASAEQPTEYVDFDDPNHLLVDELTISRDHARGFCACVGNESWQYAFADNGSLQAPIEFMTITAIRSLLADLQSSVFGAGQVNVVHMYHRTKVADGVHMLSVGDTVSTITSITGLVNLGPGKRISTAIKAYCRGKLIGT
ncbi:fatty acid synthase alpha subunit Lsd1, partial [Coemansia biformis]